MTISHLLVRRRNVVERKVLRLLRGNASMPGVAFAEIKLTRREARQIAVLRDHAIQSSFEILPPNSKYAAHGELLVLRWLAEAQREVGLRTLRLNDCPLAVSLRESAVVLSRLNLLLPPQTLNLGCGVDHPDVSMPGMLMERKLGSDRAPSMPKWSDGNMLVKSGTEMA